MAQVLDVATQRFADPHSGMGEHRHQSDATETPVLLGGSEQPTELVPGEPRCLALVADPGAADVFGRGARAHLLDDEEPVPARHRGETPGDCPGSQARGFE